MTNPITEFRKKNNMSLADLAAPLGVSRTTIFRWENGRLPKQNYWPAIESVTGITPTELVGQFGAASSSQSVSGASE